jgi:hypothetical protein
MDRALATRPPGLYPLSLLVATFRKGLQGRTESIRHVPLPILRIMVRSKMLLLVIRTASRRQVSTTYRKPPRQVHIDLGNCVMMYHCLLEVKLILQMEMILPRDRTSVNTSVTFVSCHLMMDSQRFTNLANVHKPVQTSGALQIIPRPLQFRPSRLALNRLHRST